MSPVGWAFLPPMTAVTAWWMFCLATLHYFRAWALMLSLRVLAVAAAITYGATGDSLDASAAGVVVVATLVVRYLWSPDGPR